MTWLWVLLYMALQLALGVWVSRRIRSENDYFLAGRSLSWPLVTFSMFATWFGAETCIGSSGAVYGEGLAGARVDPLGYSLCLLLMGFLLAEQLWQRKFVTLGDLFRERFGGRVEKLAVIIMVPSSLIWAAAQVRAFGQVLSFTVDLPLTLAIAISAGVVVAYTFFGGLMGDVITDLVQGGVMAVGLCVLLWMGVRELGGPTQFVQAIEAPRLSLLGPDETWLQQIDTWMVPILGSLVAQELVSRVLAAKSGGVARRSSFYACAVYLLIGSIPVLLGLVGPKLVPGLEEAEQFLPAVAQRLLSPVLFAMLAGALISAILSTIDSVLLAIGALVSHNLVLPVLGLTGERERLISARVVVVIAGVLSFVMALYAEGIYDLVETASAFGTAGILVTTLAALYWKRGNARAAAAALLTGVVVTPLSQYQLELDAPFLTSIAISAMVYVLVSLLPSSREPVAVPSA